MNFEPQELAEYLPDHKRIYSNSWEWLSLVQAFNTWNKEKNDENMNLLRWKIIDFNAACEKKPENQEW